ncbi:MAG: long-chain-fatty-acid--CoA ligase [Deltaproteobacteria bacterium]|nr:long-chain-fatty-acid--CoA ligase [Deltaproteobacteria bacterium]
MQTIGEMLQSVGRYMPDNTAVIYKGDGISYKELNAKVNQLANSLLKLGLKRGDFIMLLMPNSVEFLIAHHAIIRIGAISIPLNVMYKVHEIKYIGKESGAKAIIADAGLWAEQTSATESLPKLKHIIVSNGTADNATVQFEDLLKGSDEYPVVEAELDDITCVIYTSGTTGRPKGATQTHRSILTNVQGCCTRNKFVENDRLILGLPIYNNFALSVVMMSAFYCGATIILIDRFDARKVLDAIKEHRGTYFAGTPTMFSYLLTEFKEGHDDVSSLKMVNSGGANFPVEVVKKFEKTFGCIVMDGFGHTEGCGFTTLQPRVGIRKGNSVGTPISNFFVKIVDDEGTELPVGKVGEIIEYGDSFSIHGYLNAPEKNAEVYRDGWFYSGDLGYLDSDGYLYMTDRKQDLIITGGQNIYPVEVEEILYTHPKVELTAVIGIPDEVKGELAKAYIVLKKGESAEEQEIIDYVRERMAKFKAPRMVEFVDSLPQGPTGKILKKELREKVLKEIG